MTEAQPILSTEVPENLPEKSALAGEGTFDDELAGLPVGLPDARTAQRLLALLAQLEAKMDTLREAPPATESLPDPAILSENRALKAIQKKALARLDILLERLETQQTLPEETQAERPPEAYKPTGEEAAR